MPVDTLTGRSYPSGATGYPHGVNFCVFSKNRTALELLLFDEVDVTPPSRVIQFDPQRNKTFNFKHNTANGQRNAAGPDTNFSWNCGVEGPAVDPAIEALCRR